MDDFDESIQHDSDWPTDREFEAYFIITDILRKVIPISDISYIRNDKYMSLIYKNNPYLCVCKLYLNEPQEYIIIPFDGVIEERIDITSIYDLVNKKNQLIQALKRCLNP